MPENKTSAAHLKAVQKYKRENVKRITVDFYPAESDLWEQIEKQPKKQTYIKDLIRADMEKSKLIIDRQTWEELMKEKTTTAKNYKWKDGQLVIDEKEADEIKEDNEKLMEE